MEKIIKPLSGYILILIILGLIPVAIFSFIGEQLIMGFGAVFYILHRPPWVLYRRTKQGPWSFLLFGDYKGTVKASGFFWVNPFMTKKKISLRVRNFENKPSLR